MGNLKEDIYKALVGVLVALGLIGGYTYMTGAAVSYSSPAIEFLDNYTTWTHDGQTNAYCVAEVFITDNKTITVMNFTVKNPSGTVVAAGNGVQLSDDFLLYRSPYFNVSTTGNYNCSAYVLVSDLSTDAESYLFNVRDGLDQCLGQKVCNITVSGSQSGGTFYHQSVYISSGATLTLTGDATFNVANEFVNDGTISAAGKNVIVQNARTFNNTGSLTLTGTTGGTYAPGGRGGNLSLINVSLGRNTGTISCAGGNDVGCYGSYGSTNSYCNGGAGGGIYIYDTPSFSNTGTLDVSGGNGGNGQCTGYDHQYAGGGNGSTGGVFRLNHTNFTNTGNIYYKGGAGGNGVSDCKGYSSWDSCGGWGGNGGTGIYYGHNSTVFTSGSISASGGAKGTDYAAGCTDVAGSVGSHTVYYCGTLPGNTTFAQMPTFSAWAAANCWDWSVASTKIDHPDTGSNYTNIVENVTVNWTAVSASAYELQCRQANSSWSFDDYLADMVDYPNLTATTWVIDTHRVTPGTSSSCRIRAYNSTKRMWSTWNYSNLYNLSAITTQLNALTDPVAPWDNSVVKFQCNYTRKSDNSTIYQGTVKFNVDGTWYNASWNPTSSLYESTVTVSTLLASHYYWCNATKADYAQANSSNTSANLSGSGASAINGSVNFLCPAPNTGDLEIVPAWQTAKKGVINVRNLNASALKNYSITLVDIPANGVYIYANGSKYTLGTDSSKWTELTGSNQPCIVFNLNSTNLTAYIWLKAKCIDATTGSKEINYSVVEGC